MGCTACTEPRCLYKGALYLTFVENEITLYLLLPRTVLVVILGTISLCRHSEFGMHTDL